jgi:hypothetical protein
MKSQKHVIKDDHVFIDMENDKLQTYFHISSKCDEDANYLNVFTDFMVNYHEDNDICIRFEFDISDVLESTLDNYGLTLSDNEIWIDAKPKLMALKSKCQSMIDRIDGLAFKE